MWFELHKHSHYSLFDGFDNIKNIVKYAKELKMPALAITDHGNVCCAGNLYNECNDQGIKPIIAIEAYFQPKFDKEKPSYHLCLYAKNIQGYSNLMQIITEANEDNFYRKGIVTFEILKKYKEGIICSSACVAGIISQALIEQKYLRAKKALKVFKEIFEDDFYLEIQPIPIDEKGTQERVNKELYKLGKEYDVKLIPTTDSHYTRPDDFETYKLMHNLANHSYDIEATYGERYMHSKKQIITKLRNEFKDADIKQMLKNITEIYNKVENYSLQDFFKQSIPKCDEYEDSYNELKKRCVTELKRRNKYNKEYIDRLKTEIRVIKKQQLSDYFLIVADYVEYAWANDIYVGPGRGSVCNCLIADLLNITNVDPIEIGNDFERFIREDKIKMPDIDIDFEYGETKRDVVIKYLLEKYKGRSAQIITYGVFKVNILCNDLCKFFNIDEKENALMKKRINRKIVDEYQTTIEYDDLMTDKELRRIDNEYTIEDDSGRIYTKPIYHISKLYGQVKYFGTHAAGVVITKDKISKYVALTKYNNKLLVSMDRLDIDNLGLLKFDILGLKTLNKIHEIEKLTGDKYDFNNKKAEDLELMYDAFSKGETDGIFQLNKQAAKDILVGISTESLQDLIVSVSLNRPGPLSLKMHEHYAQNKVDPPISNVWYEYTKDTYGTLIYQEHVMRICKNLACMDNNDIDKLMKFKFDDEGREVLKQKFIKGIKANTPQMKQGEAQDLFDSMTLYLFNKGHGSGYALISEWQMYHKVKHPMEYWLSALKYVYDKNQVWEYKREAVKNGVVLCLPHVNYGSDYNIRELDDEKVIQEGLQSIKGVGAKAADFIEQEVKANGIFHSQDEFEERCKSRAVHKGVIEKLEDSGALDFDYERYLKRVTKYNVGLYK